MPITHRPTTLNFPPHFHSSISHVLRPFDELWDAAKGKPVTDTEYDVSPILRVGPLEFHILASLRSNSNPEGTGERVFILALKGQSTAPSVPWTGSVEAKFRFLNAEGKVKRSEPSKTLLLGTDRPSHIASCNFAEPEVLQLVDRNAIHLEVILDLRVKLKPGLGGEEWEIPIAILEAPNPATGSLVITPDSNWPDVEIGSSDGDKFKAHRMIMAGRSRVFKTMFETEMREKAEGVVRIEDIGSKALKILIKFIYGQSFREEIEDFEGHGREVFLELVNAGKKYEMPLLMKLAGVALMLRCTRENVLEIFAVLKKYGKEMKEVMIQLASSIKKNVAVEDD